MLFLAFLHKITPNCKVRDYKTAPFCIITYSFISPKYLCEVFYIHGLANAINRIHHRLGRRYDQLL